MSEIAVLREYSDLHRALRERAAHLRKSRLTLDFEIGGPDGYSSKLLAPMPIRRAGWKTLIPLINALNLELVLRERETSGEPK